jgi:transcriptional regulator with XRE-family HTH domain
MIEQAAPNVGPRIRAIREQHRLSLRALAGRCGLSVNAISMIERGENSPTLSSLHMLATALGVKITDFFEDADEQAVVYVQRDRRLRAQGNGIVMESLGTGLRNQQLEPFLMAIEAGAESGDDSVHPGQEFAYCIKGEIEYRIGSQAYCLVSGDSLLFEATQPHSFRCMGETPATFLLVSQAIEGSHLGRQRHLETTMCI